MSSVTSGTSTARLPCVFVTVWPLYATTGVGSGRPPTGAPRSRCNARVVVTYRLRTVARMSRCVSLAEMSLKVISNLKTFALYNSFTATVYEEN